MNTKSEAAATATARKPWLSYFLATAGGAGYLPAAPGTWGSVVGIALYWLAAGGWVTLFNGYGAELPAGAHFFMGGAGSLFLRFAILHLAWLVCLFITIIGVIVSGRVARFAARKDPQFVVIDEVSGQFFTYLLALAPLNWKYLLLGFILFRGFDTWKPFPARQAESLPGGWGIMADDWVAGIYAAIGLWIARGLGL